MALEPAHRPDTAGEFARTIAETAAATSGKLAGLNIAITRALNRWRTPGHRKPIRFRSPLLDTFGQDLVHAWRSLGDAGVLLPLVV